MKENKIPKEKKKEFLDLINTILRSNENMNKYQLKQLVIDLCFCISQLTNYTFSSFESIMRYYDILIEKGAKQNEIRNI